MRNDENAPAPFRCLLKGREVSLDFLAFLIDSLGEVNVFVKDLEGRFVFFNRRFITLCGETAADAILGRTDYDFFDADLAAKYVEDDQRVIATSEPLRNRMDLVISPETGALVWYQVHKIPVRSVDGETVGVAGIHRWSPGLPEPDFVSPNLQKALGHIHQHFREQLKLADIAQVSGVAESTLSQHFSDELGTSVVRYIKRLRLQWAADRLRHSQTPIGELALEAGFSDQSHLTREFKDLTGETPASFRRRRK